MPGCSPERLADSDQGANEATSSVSLGVQPVSRIVISKRLVLVNSASSGAEDPAEPDGAWSGSSAT